MAERDSGGGSGGTSGDGGAGSEHRARPRFSCEQREELGLG